VSGGGQGFDPLGLAKQVQPSLGLFSSNK